MLEEFMADPVGRSARPFFFFVLSRSERKEHSTATPMLKMPPETTSGPTPYIAKKKVQQPRYIAQS